MQFKKPAYKLAAIIFIISVFLFAILGLVYTQRLRNALIKSTAEYKAAIIELEKKVAKFETSEPELQQKIYELKSTLISQSVHLTNDISANYELEIDPSKVSLNHIPVKETSDSNAVQFIVAGHFYGNPHNRGVITPASTLINAVPKINSLTPDLIFSLGDLAYSASNESYQELRHNFINEINAPLFNAPGNHDVATRRNLYESEFGQTFYYFTYAQNQIIVLDTEIANCFIAGKQKEMLEQAIESALNNNGIENIFIFLHKALFLDGETDLRAEVNSQCGYGTNYTELRDEIFIPAAEIKPVYILAGDVGARGDNLSPFYEKDADTNLYTLAIGLGDTPNDALLQIDISSTQVSFQLISIGGNQLAPLETYTREYWSAP